MTNALLPPCLILAGGRSNRMGENKALLRIGSDTILRHIVRRLTPQVSAIVLNAPCDFPDPHGLQLLPDTVDGQIGPLAGLLAGLRYVQEVHPETAHLVTVPVDSPFVPRDFVERMMSASIGKPGAIVVAASNGQDHPVFGLWPVDLLDDLQAWIAVPENRRIHEFLRHHQMVTVDFPMHETAAGKLDPFFNINRPEDLEEARRFADALA